MRPTRQIYGRVGHTALKCYNRFDNNYQSANAVQVFSSFQEFDANGKEWYPDSGATTHVTATTNGLQSVTQYDGNDTIMVADGTFLPITHVGSTTLASHSGNIPISEVLVCPEIKKKSLLSVSKLCDDYLCGVFFDAKQVCVIDLTTQKVVTKGKRCKGLYMLDVPGAAAFYTNRKQAVSENMWHHRLGHSNFRILEQLQKSKEITINKRRNTSRWGRVQDFNFFSFSSVVSHPLDRIHCDLWGPSPVVSNQGFKYYAVFVDEFSRYSWFYPLRHKYEFYLVFLAFQKMVENQLTSKIKTFQSDGGAEFVNKALTSHFSQQGIRHLISCPHTPQ